MTAYVLLGIFWRLCALAVVVAAFAGPPLTDWLERRKPSHRKWSEGIEAFRRINERSGK